MSKLVNDKAFGQTVSSKIKIGDLVSWSEWIIEDNDIGEAVFFGTVIDKVTRIQGGRAVIIIIVACSKTGFSLSLNPFQLTVEETI